MPWKVRYHPAVARDLESIGHAEARAIMRVIDSRIIYRVDTLRHEVTVLAVGMRRRDEVYRLAQGRR